MQKHLIPPGKNSIHKIILQYLKSMAFYRWAHNGFKELYREELGYSEPDSDSDQGFKGNREAKGTKNSRSSPSRKSFSRLVIGK